MYRQNSLASKNYNFVHHGMAKKVQNEIYSGLIKGDNKHPPTFKKEGNFLKCTTLIGIKLTSDKKNFIWTCNQNKILNFDEFIKHLKKIHHYDNLKSCTTCQKAYLSNEELEKHNQESCIQNKFYCQLCPNRYQSYRALTGHLKKHRNDNDQPIQFCHPCKECEEILGSKVNILSGIFPPRKVFVVINKCTY